MTDKEIVQALRCCKFGLPCEKCPVLGKKDCFEEVNTAAAELIERLTAENAKAEAERDALLEIAKKGKDCETCKNRAVCVKPGTDVAHWCDRCEEKCRCYGCGGDNWEWRGISGMPVLPNEGGLSCAPGSLGAEGEQPKNEPLTLQELVELNGQPVWMGEPFNKWVRFEINSKNIQDITPEMKIRKGFMNVNGEIVEIPPVNFYRKPIKEMPAGDEQGEKA